MGKRAEQNEAEESKYPLQEVFQFTGGMRIMAGNEEGKEFVRLMMPSGTYTEIRPDGKRVDFNVGESKTYNKGGVTLSIDENNDLHIAGHNKIQVGGGGHFEVSGDVGIVAGGNIALAGLGDMGLSVNGNMYMGTKGKVVMNASEGFDMKGPSFKLEAPAVNVESQAISMNANDMGIKAKISHQGDMNTSGVHTDSIGKHVG